MIARVGVLGGDGGVIALDARGNPAFHWNSPGLKRAIAGPGRATEVGIL
jgi:L-asparaginase/beta-aspartyl-peptidase (threonine type)